MVASTLHSTTSDSHVQHGAASQTTPARRTALAIGYENEPATSEVGGGGVGRGLAASRPCLGYTERSLSSTISHRVKCWVGVLLGAAQPWRHPSAPVRMAIRMEKARPGLAVLSTKHHPFSRLRPARSHRLHHCGDSPTCCLQKGVAHPVAPGQCSWDSGQPGLSNLGGNHVPLAGPEPLGMAWGEVGSRQPTFLHPRQCFNLTGSGQLPLSLGGRRLPALTPPAPGAA